jgi:hypothetical protein
VEGARVWWAWLLIAVVVWRAMGRRRWRRHMRMKPWGHYHMHAWGSRRCGMVMMGGVDLRTQRDPAPAPPPVELSAEQKRERAVSELRRRYVADDITVEEYEAGLDRILKGE